jgi:hypothetical protein
MDTLDITDRNLGLCCIGDYYQVFLHRQIGMAVAGVLSSDGMDGNFCYQADLRFLTVYWFSVFVDRWPGVYNRHVFLYEQQDQIRTWYMASLGISRKCISFFFNNDSPLAKICYGVHYSSMALRLTVWQLLRDCMHCNTAISVGPLQLWRTRFTI